MRIRDFSLPTPYYTPMPSRSDCEERTKCLERASETNDWHKIYSILLEGPVDCAVKDAALFEALEKADDTTCAFLVAAARPLGAATDSQILVMAAGRKHMVVVETQLQYGLIQPWAIQAALKIAEQSNDRNLENLLRQTQSIVRNH